MVSGIEPSDGSCEVRMDLARCLLIWQSGWLMAHPHGRGKRSAHPGATKRKGVSLVNTAAHGWQIRWTCPFTKKRKQQTLKPLGITNAKDRQAFAEKRSEELQAQKRQLAVVKAESDRRARFAQMCDRT